MCGIAGYFGSPFEPVEGRAALERMTSELHHRGPDDAGYWLDAEAGIALGHRRLAIVDLSPAGHQPMMSASGRYVLAFNGEIYNYRQLRGEIEQTGAAPAWRGHSDTEVALAAIECWGLLAALQRFNGMFAIALWDREARCLHLARDRMGEKPLYYGWMGRTLLFGSELKALRQHSHWRGEIDRDALAAFVRHGYVPGSQAIYRGVYKLPPGHYLTLASGGGEAGEPVAYWNARERAEAGALQPFSGDADEAVGALDKLLRDAVALRMEADVPLGALLSGGIDSTTVVALMQAQASRPVRTFSIGFHEEGFNEAQHAAEVARHLGTEHTELYVTPQQAMDVIPRLPALYDEPFADSSQIPTFLVSELTRQHVTVALSGDGGDELFCGYKRYDMMASLWGRVGRVPSPLRAVAAGAIRAVPTTVLDRCGKPLDALFRRYGRAGRAGDKLHKLAALLACRSPEEMYRGLLSQWPQPDLLVPGAVEPPGSFSSASDWPRLQDMVQRLMYADALGYLPDDILVKVDRASMGVSLEARVPLLDHRLVEFAWSLPASLRARDGAGKWPLRQVLYRYVPRDIMDRPKMGFGVPIADWLRGPLRDWAEVLLAENRLRAEGYLAPTLVRQRWNEHLSGQRNWSASLWSVLMFQAWLEA